MYTPLAVTVHLTSIQKRSAGSDDNANDDKNMAQA